MDKMFIEFVKMLFVLTILCIDSMTEIDVFYFFLQSISFFFSVFSCNTFILSLVFQRCIVLHIIYIHKTDTGTILSSVFFES